MIKNSKVVVVHRFSISGIEIQLSIQKVQILNERDSGFGY